MIISVAELRKYIESDLTDEELEAKLSAIESAIRSYTNNNFQNRNIRCYADAEDGMIQGLNGLFKVGDTIQISESINNGLYVIKEITSLLNTTVDPEIPYIDANMLVTKVEYPKDVVMGAVNLLKWEIENRSKAGIQSETISRHSVTYFNMDGDNSSIGYPKSLIGFLKPYRKARF